MRQAITGFNKTVAISATCLTLVAKFEKAYKDHAIYCDFHILFRGKFHNSFFI